MAKRLSLLDRNLSLWIFAAMGVGLLLSRWAPSLGEGLQLLSVGSTNIPIAIGLIVMMFPPLAKVRYEKIPAVFSDLRLLLLSLGFTWFLGPALMFVLAITFLADFSHYMTGLILIGIAPCIAMVIVWIDLAEGNREYAAGLVGLNTIFQLLCYSAYAYFFGSYLPQLLHVSSQVVAISFVDVAISVGLYMGIPLAAGFITRTMLVKLKGEGWYQSQFLPKISPLSLIFLLFTIVVMFALKGDVLFQLPIDALRIALPLFLYFVLMFGLSFWAAKQLGASYAENAAISFTASGNNFELAMGVAIGVFGLNSPEAFAAVIGPLIEVPVLISLVQVSLKLKQRYGTNTA
jgi:arsenite transporter